MRNTILITLLMIGIIACKDKNSQEKLTVVQDKEDTMTEQEEPENIYQFVVNDLYGYKFDFSTLKGKKIMVVNTASECGLTPQYEGLQKLYDTYKDNNFVIVGFPANNFGQQEPGNDLEIAKFCKDNYGVSFPMMSKISVKGNDMNKVYKFLTVKEKNGYADTEIAWNFQKYLIDENGRVVKMIDPKTLPTDASIVSWIVGE